MAIVLGIHVGHHASCALTRDGELLAAVQLERLSRIKYHGVLALDNALPVAAVLDAAGVTLSEVDRIVSSFQGVARAGFGLHQPLVQPDFDLFDPFDARHHVISHHLAHAHCAAAYAPGDAPLAVIVSDYAGSSTADGADFAMTFSDWHRDLTGDVRPVPLQTECLSIYERTTDGTLALRDREYRVPHVAPESAVCNVASLYENITSAVLPGANQHGSLMALAAYGRTMDPDRDPGPFVDVHGELAERVRFRNDWQHAVYADFIAPLKGRRDAIERSPAARLAWLCQDAAETALLAYARRARARTGADRLAVAGGTFLNILANTRLAREGLFSDVHVPSAPNDAGISIGCAMWGALAEGDPPRRIVTDRLGPRRDRAPEPGPLEPFVRLRPAAPDDVATLLAEGAIVARCAGRSEFGPRALGGRSLLGSPLIGENKARLNRIKGRQPWRPVAPIVAAEHLDDYFDGPGNSDWMTFSHHLRRDHVGRLPALDHPDGSTRCQSHRETQDPAMHALLLAFRRRTGYAVLLNTSLNGPDEPILETPEQALRWFLLHPDVDALLLEDRVVTRADTDAVDAQLPASWRLAPDAYVLRARPVDGQGGRTVVRLGAITHALAAPAIEAAVLQDRPVEQAGWRADAGAAREEWQRLVLLGLLIPKETTT